MYWRGGALVGNREDNLARAVESWYAEVAQYDFDAGAARSAGQVVGHFTQLVWRATGALGCGVNLQCSNKFGTGLNNSVVVCRYKGPGNYAGQHTANVGELVFSGRCNSTTAIGAAAAENPLAWERVKTIAALGAAESFERALLPSNPVS